MGPRTFVSLVMGHMIVDIDRTIVDGILGVLLS